MTTVDKNKENADIRILDIDGTKNFIVWKDGRREYVTDVKLERLEKIYNVVCDF